MSLVCPCCLWFVLAPKVLQLRSIYLMWVVCRPMWVSETCQLFLVSSRSSNTPFYPSKCCELGSVPQFLPLPLSYIWTHFWVLQGVGSASIWVAMNCTNVWSYIRWVASFAIHATCLITFMVVEIQWIANGHCNSKIELLAQLQNAFSYNEISPKLEINFEIWNFPSIICLKQ